MKLDLQQEDEFLPLPTGLRAFRAEWGIILGSGLRAVATEIDLSMLVGYEEIRGLPRPGVKGHAGELAFGYIDSTPIVVAQGRVHLYEGFSATEVCAHVRLLAKLGVKRLILTNAAGALNPAHRPGGWMMLTDHLNLTGTSPLLGGPNFIDMSEVYSAPVRARFAAAAAEEGITLYEGVYAGLLGPQYETPAEIRMLSRLGADAVGMSTVLEAIQARALGLEVVGFSCLSNWAAGIGAEPLDHQAVLQASSGAVPEFVRLLRRVVGRKS